jgi:flagellar biosynthesis protein FlhF
MKVMKFEGSNMREAVAKVKAELGDQAVIVSTRQIRRGLLGTACEISAAIDDDDDDNQGPTRGFAAYQQQERAQTPSTPPPLNQELELERALSPLRGELKSLRALVRASAADSRGTAELRNEVAALRRLIEDLHTPPPTAGYLSGVDNSGARNAKVINPGAANSQLTAPSTARAIMLVGPTGVGKTTTIAKLAARAALIEGKRVSLITLDNYRVGGVDQIRTFAELIGVPLRVCESPGDLTRMISDEDDLTLIDTAGRSPRDVGAIKELAAAVANVPRIETHLVVPAASSATVIEDLANRYRGLNPSRLLFTKLDEVDEAPELSRAPARLSLPITWVTTGQSVPEDIEEPTNARVLELASTGLHLRTNAA